MRLDLGGTGDPDAAFEAAEAAEATGDMATAVRLYGRCLALDPRDQTLYVSIKSGEKEPKGSAESVARVQF